MPKASPLLGAFNAGELSPLLDGRTDIGNKHGSGARSLINWIPSAQGPLIRRPGFEFVHPVKDGSSDNARLIPFEFNDEQAYILELGDLYMRVYADGGIVTDTSTSITAASQANPCTITASGHGLSNGDRVLITGVVGMTELNNREFEVAGVSGADFDLLGVNSSTYTAYSSGGTVKRIYEVVAPYAKADVDAISFAQSADKLYLAHKDYAPRVITRTSNTAWTVTLFEDDSGDVTDWPALLPENADREKRLTVLGDEINTTGLDHYALAPPLGYVITAIADLGGGSARITFASPHPYVVGEWIVFDQMHDGCGYETLEDVAAEITAVTATTIDIDLDVTVHGSTFTQVVGRGGAQVTRSPYWISVEDHQDSDTIGSVLENLTSQSVIGISVAGPNCRITLADTNPLRYSIGDEVIIWGVGRTGNTDMFEINHLTGTVQAIDGTGPPFDWIDVDIDTSTFTAYDGTEAFGRIARTADLARLGPFAASDEGRYFAMWEEGIFDTERYRLAEGVGAIDTFEQRHNAGLTYWAEDAGGGQTPPADTGHPGPLHEFGVQYDPDWTSGPGPVSWRFLHNGGCVFRIAKYISPGIVLAAIKVNEIPKNIRSGGRDDVAVKGHTNRGTYRWAFGGWGGGQGYPRAVEFFQDRLWWGGTRGQPQALWASVVGDYGNYRRGDQDDESLLLILNAAQVNVIEWLSSGEVLSAGTAGGEWVVAASDRNEALTVSNAKATRHSAHGSKEGVQPVRVGNVVLFPQRAGRKLREFVYSFDSDSYLAPDLTVLAEHITRGGITNLSFQQEPHRVVWCTRTDGGLIGMTYERDQQVVAWTNLDPAGTGVEVESVAVIPHPDGDEDQVWAIVKRTIDGGTERYVEKLGKFWRRDDGLFDSCWVDSALTYSGSATTSITGLWHLRGESVQVLRRESGGDYAVETLTVSSTGGITLSAASVEAAVGLLYNADYRSMRLEAGAADGTAQGKMGKIDELVIRHYQTGGSLLYGPVLDASEMDTLTLTEGAVHDGDSDLLAFPGTNDREKCVAIRHGEPYPAHLIALMPQLKTRDR